MVVGTIAGFLLLMVGAGADRRRVAERDPAHREFGLRRAKGATIRRRAAQVLRR